MLFAHFFLSPVIIISRARKKNIDSKKYRRDREKIKHLFYVIGRNTKEELTINTKAIELGQKKGQFLENSNQNFSTKKNELNKKKLFFCQSLK